MEPRNHDKLTGGQSWVRSKGTNSLDGFRMTWKAMEGQGSNKNRKTSKMMTKRCRGKGTKLFQGGLEMYK